MNKDSEVAAYDALMDAGLLEPIKERLQWEIDGERQQTEHLKKIGNRLRENKYVSKADKNLYRVLTGDVDYSEADAGMERVIRYQE